LAERVKQKRQVFNHYLEAFSEIKGIDFMPEAKFGQATRWLTVLTVDKQQCGVSSAEIIDFLLTENIEARPVWKPLHLQPLFQKSDYFSHDDDSSVSDTLFENGLCLPSGSNMTEDEQDKVIKCLKKCLRLA
jgi:pyridoxal phosphate-dependent aminotransferase EpsN